MHSSTSSFRTERRGAEFSARNPRLNIGRAWLIAVLFCVVGTGLWEWKWRAFGVTPTYRNSDGLWAMQRRRISNGEGDATVLIGSSRVLFDVQLPVWERVFGQRPIQLALEGRARSSRSRISPTIRSFTGRLLVGVSPPLFFSGFDLRVSAVKNWARETPSQRAGQWLSMTFLEPFLAFYDDDFRLMTVLRRQPWWPSRQGVFVYTDVRRLATHGPDRQHAALG
jgi:hypothetical protein